MMQCQDGERVRHRPCHTAVDGGRSHLVLWRPVTVAPADVGAVDAPASPPVARSPGIDEQRPGLRGVAVV